MCVWLRVGSHKWDWETKEKTTAKEKSNNLAGTHERLHKTYTNIENIRESESERSYYIDALWLDNVAIVCVSWIKYVQWA